MNWSKESQQAWALCGGAAIIVILLLLDWGDNVSVSQPGATGGVTWPPFDPVTLELTSVPPSGYPFYLNVGGPTSTTYNLSGGPPCACGCDGPGATINGLDLTSQIAALNATLMDGAISGVQSFFSQVPQADYWATNATQLAFLNNSVDLPSPVYGS